MKIVATGRNFATKDTTAIEMLRAAGHEVVIAQQAMGTGTSAREVYETVGDADIAIAGLEPYNAEVIAHCPNLKIISRRGIGYDAVDLQACRERGITLLRTVGAVEGAVAEQVIAYIFYFARQLHVQTQNMHAHQWLRQMVPGVKTRKLGLVGFGGIGKEIATRATALGMEVAYYCRHPRAEWDAAYNVHYLPLDELLAESDYVSCNVPLTESTLKLFDAKAFAKMKQGSIFINIARSLVMDEEALADAVRAKHLDGAAVDVFQHEPCTDSPLHKLENIVLTPHTAPFTTENFITMNNLAAKNVLDLLAGTIDEKYITR